MNYEEMSDFELSKHCAEIFLDASDVKELTYDHGKSCAAWGNSIKNIGTFDINNPSCVWPIIVENGISLNRSSMQMDGYIWQAGGNFKTQHRDKNPLRAAIICFLKMKDAENKQ